MTTHPFIFEFRRGTASDWTNENPVLHSGEPGYETDTRKLKIGDGQHAWHDLAYYPPSSLSVAGVATVDGRTGDVTLADLYAAIVHTHPQSAVTGLTSALAGKADATHTHAESDVTSLTSDLAAKAASVHTHSESDVTGLSGDLSALSTSIGGKAASVHTHVETDVTGLVSDLSGKAASSHTHAGADITSGTVGIAELPTGTSGSTVALGNHSHSIPPPVTLTDGATIAVDASLGNYFRLNLTGDHTLGTPSNPVDGQRIVVEVTQGSGGTHLLTLNSSYAFSDDMTTITLSTAAGKKDLIGLIYNSTVSKWLVVAFIKGF